MTNNLLTHNMHEVINMYYGGLLGNSLHQHFYNADKEAESEGEQAVGQEA